MGLIKRLYRVDKEVETDILRECKDVFTELGCVPGQHHIQIDPAVAPVIHPPRKVPLALKSNVNWIGWRNLVWLKSRQNPLTESTVWSKSQTRN